MTRPPIAEGLPHTSEREPGRTAYSTDGCRCDECREANAAYYRERRGGLSAAAFAPKSETEEWKAEGACRDHDPDVFFPDRGEDTDTAKRICAGCTVRRECLTYAITAPRERNGIWGGTSGRERRKLTLASIEGRPLPPIVYTAEAIAATRARQSAAAKARRPAPTPPAPRGRKPQEINHGTAAGYRAHLRRCELACDECREAHRAETRAAYLRSKARRQAEREAIAATVVEIGPRRATGRILEGASR